MRSLMLTLGFLSLLALTAPAEANHRQTARFSFHGGHHCASTVPVTTAFSYRRSVAFVPRTTAALTLVQPFQVTQRYNVVAPAAVSFRPRVAYTPVPTAAYAPQLTYAAPAPCPCEQPTPVPVPTPTPFSGGSCYGSGCYGGGCSGLSVQGMSYPQPYADAAATDYGDESFGAATGYSASAGVGAVGVDVASPYAALLAVQERQRRGLLARLFHRRHHTPTPAPAGFTIREGRRGFTFRGGY
jgi:hypothetical protein